jgi:hypothetical protein
MISMLVVRLTFKIKVLKMEHVFQMGYKEGDKVFYVATLALGSRPRQGFTRLLAKKEAESCTTYSRDCEKG